MFGLFNPGSAVIDDISDRITEDFIVRAYSNNLVTHLKIGDFLENGVDELTLLNDEAVVLDVKLDQSEIETQQSQSYHVIHDFLQLAYVPCLH